MKCEICKTKIRTIFLGKILGTIVKKKKYVCFECQRKYKNKLPL